MPGAGKTEVSKRVRASLRSLMVGIPVEGAEFNLPKQRIEALAAMSFPVPTKGKWGVVGYCTSFATYMY